TMQRCSRSSATGENWPWHPSTTSPQGTDSRALLGGNSIGGQHPTTRVGLRPNRAPRSRSARHPSRAIGKFLVPTERILAMARAIVDTYEELSIRRAQSEIAEAAVHIIPATNLACPIDGLPIETHGAQRRCAAGHSFDMAREGHCNFLVVQHKASRDPADRKHMGAARRRFLDAGHFEPIADLVFDTVRNCAKSVDGIAFNIIDAGCGEGYYLDRLPPAA